MKCPFCNNIGSEVTDSRSFNDGEYIRRRRRCIECKKRYTTHESIHESIKVDIKIKPGKFSKKKHQPNVYEAIKRDFSPDHYQELY